MKSVKDIIRDIREDSDLNQSEIAAVLGIAQQYYSKYETGEYELPIRHLVTLAKYYNVSADFLLGLTQFKGNIDKLNEALVGNITIGKLLSDSMSLDESGRKSVVEYVELMRIKQMKAHKNM